MKKTLFFISLTTLYGLLLSGCFSKALSIGYDQGYCEERGCGADSVGSCESPYSILEKRF